MKKSFGLFLLGLFTLSLAGCGASSGIYPDADKYLVGNQTYSENITSLDVDWISGSLTLIEDENIQGVKISEETDLLKEEEWVHSYLNNGELKVKFFASGYRLDGIHRYKKDLTIAYKPTLTNIKIDLTSGSFKADKITAASKCEIDITSGDVRVNHLLADTVKTHQTSGLIELKKIEANEQTSDMTSGILNVNFTKINKATLDMTSGDINMTLPDEGGKVKVSKTSGSVVTNRECTISDNLYTFGSGTADINVSMTSGLLTIK